MTDAPEIEPTKPPRRYLRRMTVALASAFLMVGLLAGGIVLFFSGQTIEGPDWAKKRLVDAINESIAPARVGLSGLDLTFRDRAAPIVSLRGIRVFDANDVFLAWVPNANLSLDRRAIIAGDITPEAIQIEGLRLSLNRSADGDFDVEFGANEGAEAIGGTPAELINELNRLFASPGLETLKSITATNVALKVTDQKAKRVWDITDGTLKLSRLSNGADLSLGFATEGFGDQAARVEMSVFAKDNDLAADFGLRVDGLATNNIAAWDPSLSWLRLIWAPASGAMRLQFDEDGEIGEMNATLDLGRGTIQVPNTQRAISLSEGRTYFSFDPEKRQVVFDELSLITSDLSLQGEGQILLRDGPSGAELVTQLQVSEVTIAPKGVGLDQPVTFTSGSADMRLLFDPFRLDVGQVALAKGDSRFLMKGQLAVTGQEFSSALDVSLDRIATDDFLAMWPPNVVADTRVWLGENLLGGEIKDASVSLRGKGDEEPVVGVGFTFDDAIIQFLPEQPPIIQLDGYGALTGKRLTIVADRAFIRATDDALLDASGTVFAIGDTDARPGVADIDIQVTGPLEGQLALLDRPPFRFLSRAGQPTDVATGQATTRARVSLPLLKIVPDDQIYYAVEAQAQDVLSDVLIPGHVLKAERLAISATKLDGLQIAGRATVSGIPVEGSWNMPLDDGSDGSSRLAGALSVSQETSDVFALGLPDGTINGTGLGRVEIDFPNKATPKLRFFTDLNRLRLALPPIGWAKAAARTGALEVLVDLADPPVVTSLVLDAPGLKANGAVTLDADGSLDLAAFDNLQIGRWFNGDIELIGRGADRPFDIAVKGGRMDLRSSEFGTSSGDGAGALGVILDRLDVSESISLTGLRGDFDPSRGLQGRFFARVNGRTEVTGSLVPSRHGTALTLNSDNGGGVLRDAGLLDNGVGGLLKMTLVPREREGYYDGTLEIADIRVKDAPALAELFSAVSVIGLLEQMDGGGLPFNLVSAEFVLTPERVVVQNSRAVGASLGITMDGEYNLASGLMDMQGVVSPIYVINGIGQLVSRQGEGLIGISYRMRGDADDPKVSANPLSILTPGFLRDIFRKPAKKIDDN